MHTFPVNVSSLLGEPGYSVEVDDVAPLDELTVGDTLAVFVARPRVRATISNTVIGLVVTGTVTARARVECSRCLEPFTMDIEGSLEGGFLLPGHEVDEDSENEWLRVEGDEIDLMPSVLGALGIEIPFAPVHDDSCQGICSVCGCDLNRERCECEPEVAQEPEGPFAALKDLITPDE